MVEYLSIHCPCYSYLKVYWICLDSVCHFLILSYGFAVILMHWNAPPGNMMSCLLILLLPDDPSSFSIFCFKQWDKHSQPLVWEKYTMDRRRSSSGSNTLMVYSYKQDRVFICNDLFYIFVERNKLISDKHVIFGLYTK